MKTAKFLGGLFAAAVLLGAGCASGNQAATGEPYKLGFAGPLTGDAAVYGEPARNMIQMAVDEVNAQGGVDGHNLQLVSEDAKCNGKDAASAAQKLINVDKVQVLMTFCSGESLAALPIAEQSKVVILSAGSSSPALTGKSKYFFRNYPSDASQGKVLAEAALAKGWKKVAFIQEQTDYALGIYNAFEPTFKAGGGTVVKQEFASTVTDFRSLLAKLKAENPDALFLDSQAPAGSARILKQMGEMKWSLPLLGNDAISGDPKTVEQNAAALEGALAAEFGIDPSNKKFQDMLKNYKAKYGAEAPYQSYAQTEYDSVFLIADGIKKVGYNGEKLADWSRTIKDWEGASGKATIGADGDRIGGHVLKVIKGGKVVKAE